MIVSLEELIGLCNAHCVCSDGTKPDFSMLSLEIEFLLFDSRRLNSAERTAFFALRSTDNDGHCFIEVLYEKGVRVFVCSSLPEVLHKGVAYLLVEDTLKALQDAGAYARKAFHGTVLAITGSNGKTIVKEWVRQLIAQDRKICFSPRSYNSQIGVAVSLWQLNNTYEAGIFEAGISKPDEMQRLHDMILPETGLFTNIGEAHGVNFHSMEEKINEKKVEDKVEEQIKVITIPETLTIKELADKMKLQPSVIIKKLFLQGQIVTVNSEISFEDAENIAIDYEIICEKEQKVDVIEELLKEDEDAEETLVSRPPVICVMGHVDHGKTSLLDAIRKTNVTDKEAGGITQHIGAYKVNYQGKQIVFLDTPGHEAFTAMRARGAQVTDVAILVVAADDGVMPQTIEAINHAKAAKVPIIVAINKIDRPGANPDHVKQQLAEHELIPEDWGGDTIMVPVSAHQKTGISDLLEMILLVAEMQELKANPNLPAHGTIIEAQLDKGRGPVATVLVQRGTLHIGDTIIAGTSYGKVRAMINDRGEKVKKALPSTPVEVLGLNDVPAAGDILDSTDEKTARGVAEKRIAKKKEEEIKLNSKVSLDDLFQRIKEGEIKELNIVVKADVQGTIEALKASLEKIKNDEVKVAVVHAGVGAITESDVMLASAANALIIGFNVRPDANARKAAETEKVDVRTYRVIYDAINDVEAAIKGMLAPKFKEVIQGRVEIRQMITISKLKIAGCYVVEGKVTNSSKVRVVRDGIVVHEGVIESLRRFKDDVKEVAQGFECGITLEKFSDLKEGDIFEVYDMEEIAVE